MVNFMLVTLFLMCVKVMPSVEDKLPNDLLDWRPIEERNAITNKYGRWTNGTVHYVVDETYTKSDLRTIRSAMDEMEKHTCIRWVPIRDEDISKYKSYVSIENDMGCWSEVGRTGVVQSLSLESPACIDRGTILHELLHALGFQHEHQRPDREEYVTVNWDNILGDGLPNFESLPALIADTQGLPYDYRSVLHYTAYLWAVNKSIPTLEPNPTQSNLTLEDLGHGLEHGYLTELDIQRINKFYECPS